jgi:tripartite-type tricarboxylate transporter receptor subunit TctC
MSNCCSVVWPRRFSAPCAFEARCIINFCRRKFLHLAAGAAALPTVARPSVAQSYPSRPVRIIVGFAPGGGNDIAARLIGQWLSQRIGQRFVIENRPGAGGNIATEAVVNAAPDGYTLLLVNNANATNATLYDKLNFNFIRDIVPVAGIARVPNLMLVNPAVPASTVPEFIAYARSSLTKVNIGSGGTGGPVHMAGALFDLMTGLDMQHVPYRGEALALADLIGGQVQVVFGSAPASIQYVRAGKLHALAVTTTTRAEALPHVPTVADFVSGYEASTWYGIGAPYETPAEIIERLNREINAGLDDPALRTRLNELGGMTIAGAAADLGKLIAADTEKWGKVIRAANIKPE